MTKRVLALAGLLVLALGMIAAFGSARDEPAGSPVGILANEQDDDTSPLEAARAVWRLDGVDNVETSLHALGSMWAVTSNRPDRYSAPAVEAQVVRIDPTSGHIDQVLDSVGLEPTMVELDGNVWVRLLDRIVALDGAGTEGVSLPINPGARGEILAGTDHLWIIDFDAATASAVDPQSASVVHTIATGAFPSGAVAAFGHLWIPSLTDGTVTIIDEVTLGEQTLAMRFVSSVQLKTATPVVGGRTGDEVWLTNIDGDVFAVTATGTSIGEVRQIPIDVAINRIHAHGQRLYLLPIWGRDVLVFDLVSEAMVARIPTASIPFKALVTSEFFWVAGDGMEEILTAIDRASLTVAGQFPIGSNASNTNGPHRPVAVDDQIWVPNRSDNAFFIIAPTTD